MKKNNFTITDKYDVFIATKPYQYINVLNIEYNISNKKILILIDSFYNARFIYNKIVNQSTNWNDCLFLNNMNETFNWLIINKNTILNLYIDSDVNNKLSFFKLRHVNISVYEEGVGSYNKYLYKPRRKVLGNFYLMILSLLGYNNRRGGSRFTKNIILYFPDFYKLYINEKSKSILSFKKPFIDHLQTCTELIRIFGDIDVSMYIQKKVLLYISDWEIREEDISDITNLIYDIKILKPHPHIKNKVNDYKFDFYVENEYPAELLILKLVEVVDKLLIVSKYSSSTIYFFNHPKVSIINQELSSSEYENTNSYLDAYINLSSYISKDI